MAGYYPADVTQADIDRAAGGYDPPACECIETDTMDAEACLLHGPPQPHESVAAVAEAVLGNSLSPTQVRTFLDCSARWWFKYGLHLPEPKTGKLALEIALHQALETNFREELNTKQDLPVAGVTAVFRQAWAVISTEAEFRDDENPNEIANVSEVLVTKHMEEVASMIEPAAVELDVEGEIGGVSVLSKVDLIDTAGRVVDVKTSARKPTGIAADYAFQLATYRRLAPGASGKARLRTLVKTKTVQLIQQSYRVGEADLRSTEVLYSPVQEGIRNELYFPNRQSTLCSRRNCAFWRQGEREFVVEES